MPLPPDSSANSVDRRDWAAIAHHYAASALTVPEICALYSVSRSVLYNRASLDGWIKRSAARRAAALHRPPLPHTVKGEADLSRRLLTALDHKMKEFETRMTQAATAPATAADSERDARTLNTLVRLFDRLKGFGAKAVAGAGGPAASRTAGKDSHDADRFRHDLARRLESLRDSIGG
jgi:hypothetical protein